MEGPDDRPYYLTPNDVADWCVPSLAWVASVLMVVISFYLYDVGFKCLVHPPHTLSLRRRSLFSSPPLCVLIVLQDGVLCSVVLWMTIHKVDTASDLFIISSFLLFFITINKVQR